MIDRFSVAQLQHSFSEVIFSTENDAIISQVQPSDIAIKQRLAIYQRNVNTVLTDTLRSIYPAVCAIVDQRFFDYAAHAYIADHPSKSGNLDDYGEAFAGFLSSFEPVASLPYLPDLARLEWCYHQAYRAADVRPLAVDALQNIPSDQYELLRFSPHPSLHLFSSPYPIDQLKLLEKDENTSVDFDGGIKNILVVRPAYDIECYRISSSEMLLMHALCEGKTLYEAFCAVEDELFELTATMARFISFGCFSLTRLAL